MKLKHILFFLVVILGFYSCIKSEDPNAEADIVSCKIIENNVLNTEPLINNEEAGNYSISLFVKKEADITKITPVFELTAGATIEPESGVTQDFTSSKKYVVTSEDKQWQKEYTVSAIQTNLPTSYSFEETSKSDKYDTFVETYQNNVIMSWASGNPGFSITGAAQSPLDFPTVQDKNGYKGACAKLTTRSTGQFGSDVGMPIAAGNLFIGKFNLLAAISNPLKATQFGLPFNELPTHLTGYYKYKAGEVFQEKETVIKGKKDKADIYAIFYETDRLVQTLDGSNALTHRNLVAIARLETIKESNDWVRFNIPFNYKPNKQIDFNKLENGEYKLGILFTSSIEGDKFNGAIGSTLWIDEVEVIYNLELTNK